MIGKPDVSCGGRGKASNVWNERLLLNEEHNRGLNDSSSRGAATGRCHLSTVSLTNLANSFTSSSVVSKEHIHRTTDSSSFQT
jgi:hypothetical protein